MQSSMRGSEASMASEDSRFRHIVFVWDLDETLIIFNSLWNGTYAKQYDGAKDVSLGMMLGSRWEKLILTVSLKYFFYEELEDLSDPLISSWIQYDDGADLSNYNFEADNFNSTVVDKRKLAYRYRFVSELYSRGLASILTDDEMIEWRELYEATDEYTDGWLSAGRKLLAACLKVKPTAGVSFEEDEVDHLDEAGSNRFRSVNLLVTSGLLIPSVVKCLLFRLDDFMECDNIRSSRDVPKLPSFRRIKNQFSHTGTRFCVIGDGKEECLAAEKLRWPFLRVEMGPSGVNRLPTLTIETIELYMRVVYDDPVKGGGDHFGDEIAID